MGPMMTGFAIRFIGRRQVKLIPIRRVGRVSV
jgi:hypothetical protein